jgi:CheY-like chemotaxis protein
MNSTLADSEQLIADLQRQLAECRAERDEALEYIEPQLIVILSDINMPVMDGLELLREIKTRRPDVPVIMVTAYGDDERRRLAGEYGATEFITKPVDFDFLKTQLRDLSDAAD